MTKAEKVIREHLFANQDLEYQLFQSRVVTNIDADSIIGVRTPILRTYAKELSRAKDRENCEIREAFLNTLPHKYFEENQLHSFIISEIKDYELCMSRVQAFLPYIDNWATCDQLSPKVFRKHLSELDLEIEKWMSSSHPYTIRYGIEMRMNHFLEDAFAISQAEKIAAIHSEEYYVRMMVAWYLATALAKQYDAVLPILQSGKMETWTHNKTIQKAVESYRITPEQKEYLKTLKIKK